jgi:hypothetical protein
MKRILLASIAVLALAACDPKAYEGAPIPESMVPEGLKDCKFYTLQRGSGQTFNIVRCPNSSTSLTRPGKSTEHTATIDSTSVPGQTEADAHAARVDALVKKIDDEIARLEAKKKELK